MKQAFQVALSLSLSLSLSLPLLPLHLKLLHKKTHQYYPIQFLQYHLPSVNPSLASGIPDETSPPWKLQCSTLK